MEAIAAVVSDACLSDCIEALGDNAENPTTDQLREVLPGLVERHGVGMTRIMLAATVAGEAPAAAIIRDLLKHDELVGVAEGRGGPTRGPDRPGGAAQRQRAGRAAREAQGRTSSEAGRRAGPQGAGRGGQAQAVTRRRRRTDESGGRIRAHHPPSVRRSWSSNQRLVSMPPANPVSEPLAQRRGGRAR